MSIFHRALFPGHGPGLVIAAILAAFTYFTWPERTSCLYRDAAGALQTRC